jgi:hypothetical protein
MNDEDIVSLEVAGVQVVGTVRGFRELELLEPNELGEPYTEYHADYFYLRVYLHEDHPEGKSVFVYIKDKKDIHAVMDKLLDTWVDVRLEITDPDKLAELLGIGEVK